MPSAHQSPAAIRVLVTDDEEPVRALLSGALSASGCEVELAASGPEALARAERAPFDVILLDLILPGLDGIEICRRLKSQPATAHVPIILVTGATERQNRFDAMGAGANDFITKPVDCEELVLRVRNAARTKRLYDAANANYQSLKATEAHRDTLVQTIAESLHAPALGIRRQLEAVTTSIAGKPGAGGAGGAGVPPELALIEQAEDEAATLADIVESLVDVAKLESGRVTVNAHPCDLRGVASEARSLLGKRLRGIVVEVVPPPGSAPANVDAKMAGRLMARLMAFAASRGATVISVDATPSPVGGWLSVKVSDNGAAIPPALCQTLFDSRPPGGSAAATPPAPAPAPGRTGIDLGLIYSRLVVEAHGGNIRAESSPSEGTSFHFDLPMPTTARGTGGPVAMPS